MLLCRPLVCSEQTILLCSVRTAKKHLLCLYCAQSKHLCCVGGLMFALQKKHLLCRPLGRVHTDNFTRRAYRSRTVRVGLPVYTLRPLRRVRPVGLHSDYIRMCSQWTRTVRVGLALQCECSVDASDASGRERRTDCHVC